MTFPLLLFFPPVSYIFLFCSFLQISNLFEVLVPPCELPDAPRRHEVFFFLPSLSVVCSPDTSTSKYMQYLGFQILRTQKFVPISFSNSRFLSSLSLLHALPVMSSPCPSHFHRGHSRQNPSYCFPPRWELLLHHQSLSCKPQILILKSPCIHSYLCVLIFLLFSLLTPKPVFALSERCLSHRDIQ